MKNMYRIAVLLCLIKYSSFQIQFLITWRSFPVIHNSFPLWTWDLSSPYCHLFSLFLCLWNTLGIQFLFHKYWLISERLAKSLQTHSIASLNLCQKRKEKVNEIYYLVISRGWWELLSRTYRGRYTASCSAGE